ncbi:MAG: orotate phosphoribosyltransferase [Candidatus Paceibacterota bacterium]|jgi:orotate phosphoribosyltransferase
MKSAGEFIRSSLAIGALELVPEGRALKSGRISPYFFNSGLFNSGARINLLAKAYLGAIMDVDWSMGVEVFFGPAYKGIPLVVAIAMMSWHQNNFDIGYSFNRKEAKDHGEGGIIIGHPMEGRDVLIIDDVMTTGSSSGEAVELVLANGGTPVGCVIGFDRQERGLKTDLSAVQEFEKNYGIPVCAAATLTDLISILKVSKDKNRRATLKKILKYQETYGV